MKKYIQKALKVQPSLSELITKFNKVAIYKINMQKCFFLYTNNELSEREPNKTITLTTASERTKYLGINLIKPLKNLYSEISKT